jgi:hypothetical protein
MILTLIIGGFFVIFISKKEKTVSYPSEKSALDEIWMEYTNSQLGFSIKFPQKVYSDHKCPFSKLIPVKIFEDDVEGIVYITEEYQYNENCEKVFYSLDRLREIREELNKTRIKLWGYPIMAPKPPSGWAIVIATIRNKDELDKFIKENYGPKCLIGKENPWKQEGVYEIIVRGEEENWELTDLETTTCPLNYSYKVLYAPEKNKAMSVELGQECTFKADPYGKKCYDEDILSSFKFD